MRQGAAAGVLLFLAAALLGCATAPAPDSADPAPTTAVAPPTASPGAMETAMGPITVGAIPAPPIAADSDDGVPRHWPVAYEERKVISTFGWRSGKLHRGIDIKAPTATPVLAAASGVVVESQWRNGYGNTVLIEHESGFTTRYAHLQTCLVHEGQRVTWGDTIGELGSTGRASTHHVHFEILQDGELMDPAFFLPAYEYAPEDTDESTAE